MTSQVCAKELTHLPQMDTGAPSPLVLASERLVALSYWLRESGRMAVLTFNHSIYHRLGSPNDEALQGHPYYAAGAHSYGTYSIEGSPLIEELARVNSVHLQHNAARYLKYTHYFFTFHDSTFECVATDLDVSVNSFSDEQTTARFHRMNQLFEGRF